ncbi:hypothetical protein [uncultured Methylobacterium sp.]|uniref:hypothetical protein n=1 Tax=uncultured Methylobacterium sp. TaxID=157278 RepID=UPI0035CB1800
MGSHVLHLVLAAIVLIALQFLPSSASAHSGHDREGHAHGRHVAHHEMTLVQSVDPAASRTETASSGPSAGMAVMAPSHGEPCALNCLACAGGGTACCGAVMILPSAPGLPRRASLPVAVAARDVPTPTGIGPKALHEPPKPNA